MANNQLPQRDIFILAAPSTYVKDVAMQGAPADSGGMMENVATEAQLKRLAIQIALILPEDYESAVKVLEYLVDLHRGFLASEPTKKKAANLTLVP